MAESNNSRLTTEERVFLIKTFYKTDNKSETCRRFQEKFGRAVKRDTIANLIYRFEITGSCEDLARCGRPKSVCNSGNRQIVEDGFMSSPRKSTRRASKELGISQTSIVRLLHDVHLKPYRPHLLHSLNEDDYDRRVEFSQIFQQLCNEDATFPEKIIWSDEATFKLNGQVNRHNSVYWAHENPHEILQKEVNAVGVTVWIGVSASGLVGPFFFEGTVTGDSYVSMLNNNFLPSVENWPLGEMWFQQDGAPPHYSIAARNWLNDNFQNRWIGRRGSIEYPPRSPDLTPADFFLWGVLKNSVYAKKPRTKDQLVAMIMNSCTEISEDLCRSVCYSVVRKTAKCIEEGGQHFEHLLR